MTASVVKSVIFTILVPGTVAVVAPVRLGSDATTPSIYSSIRFLPMALGAALYLRCAWDLASAG